MDSKDCRCRLCRTQISEDGGISSSTIFYIIHKTHFCWLIILTMQMLCFKTTELQRKKILFICKLLESRLSEWNLVEKFIATWSDMWFITKKFECMFITHFSSFFLFILFFTLYVTADLQICTVSLFYRE